MEAWRAASPESPLGVIGVTWLQQHASNLVREIEGLQKTQPEAYQRLLALPPQRLLALPPS